jgi:hypothetical protein
MSKLESDRMQGIFPSNLVDKTIREQLIRKESDLRKYLDLKYTFD